MAIVAASVPSDEALQPLRYHKDLVDYLRTAEPAVWDWSQSVDMRRSQADEVRAAMLRETYRLEPEGHAAAFAACRTAMERLAIDAPITLYQASDGTMNAGLCYIPGEIHLIFSGPILEKLTPDELLALMGHELAHYRLWGAEDGAFFNASRILDQTVAYGDAAPAHRETARLLSLHTELYADRGAAIAAQAVEPAVSVLVKTMTGLASVDPAAYLRQAEELESSDLKSQGHSHPEAFLRARALSLWWQQAPDLDAWLERRLHGPLSIETLDLLRQKQLTALTRRFLARFLTQPGVGGESVLTQVRSFFPDFQPDEAPIDQADIAADRIDDATRDYLVALMLDCAMADADARDAVLTAAARTAAAFDGLDRFRLALKRDLHWQKGAIDRLVSAARKAA
ncbi:M48 family metalloprotease [Sphingomonas jatrophae]|uniref:Zn-dependent protease with chaperone function n=1 Tax=Sphingomonas jatrophae TaxID=1166337 RepID=A0A1I6M833_9SPHN|nr:M48 family metalloprotease [Sphingomonas jatrophae]SFS11831.1 Zn-dependent protease with chaperone function [Sphingomonas jatrophae]